LLERSLLLNTLNQNGSGGPSWQHQPMRNTLFSIGSREHDTTQRHTSTWHLIVT
jgi:hypothetical protein